MTNQGHSRELTELSVKKAAKMVNCGLVSGLLQAILFNPWDRALYLSVKEARPFLTRLNFKDPFAGVTQTVVQRAISAGLYFPLEEIFTLLLKNHIEDSRNEAKLASVYFLAGTLAGIVNGVLMNPFTIIKYQFWGRPDGAPVNFFSVAMHIIKTGGVRHLFVGTLATVQRDLVFGGCFATMRHELLPAIRRKYDYRNKHDEVEKEKANFVINLLSATTATLLSSPINYVRNMHYATPPDTKPASTVLILRELFSNAAQESTALLRLHYIQSRLRLGWGTARVGCGMAFGAKPKLYVMYGL
eukprot:gene30607-36983_t